MSASATEPFVLDTPTPERHPCARYGCGKPSVIVQAVPFDRNGLGPSISFYGSCAEHLAMERTTMNTFSVVHHAYKGDPHYRSSAEYAEGWVEEPAPGAPGITEAAFAALTREVNGTRDPADGRTCWHHVDGNAWDAVQVLHRRGLHEDAVSLARLLRWCDERFTGRDHGMWEIKRNEVSR